MKKEDFMSIMESILEESKKTTRDNYSEEIEILKESEFINSSDEFNFMFMYKIEKIVNAIKGDMTSLYLNYPFYKYNILELVKKISGSCCSVDKAITIIKDYEEYKLNGTVRDYSVQYFNIPKAGSFEEWMEFVESLNSLYYGINHNYLLAYNKILKQVVAK